MRILVLRGGAVGDFLVTIPALRALHARWPGAEVALIGHPRAAQLGRIDGCVQAVHDQHAARWAPLFRDGPLPPDLDQWLDGFDLVVNFWPDPGGELTRRFTGRPLRFVGGSAQVAAAPAAQHFLAPLAALGCTSTELAPVIAFGDEHRAEARSRLGGRTGLIAVHAGSGARRKTWPRARWHELAPRLRAPLLWISGEADGDLRPPPGLSVIQAADWPLPVLGAALAHCAGYLGHDTGISHLTAAAGVPRGLLLFGPTDPAVWAPPTERFETVRAPGGVLDELTLEAVLAAAGRQGLVAASR